MNTISSFEGDYEFLSNFYESPIIYNGITFPTVEHFFQAMKTLEPGKVYEIAKATTPGMAKRLGRNVKLRPDWENVKVKVMRKGLELKFQNPALREKLLATGDAFLKEGNTWHDNIWGSCTCERCGDHGQNLLGQLLMAIREEILDEMAGGFEL